LLCSHGMRHMDGEPLTGHPDLPATIPHL
jgi:hypothetical protein